MGDTVSRLAEDPRFRALLRHPAPLEDVPALQLLALARALGVTCRRSAVEVVAKCDESVPCAPLFVGGAPSSMPVVTGPGLQTGDALARSGRRVGWVPIPSTLDPSTYVAVRVPDDEMSPILRAGDIALVERDVPPSVDTLVLIAQPQSGLAILHVRRTHDTLVELGVLVPAAAPDVRIVLPHDDASIAGQIRFAWCPRLSALR